MKATRQAKILELIRHRSLETQEDLMKALQDCGFSVTQATVSRDIKELHLLKVQNGTGGYHYVAAQKENTVISPKFNSIFRDAVQSIDYACNLVVVKCHVGMAQAACAAMDSRHWPSVIGTLAGDDTFVCITKTTEDAVALTAQLQQTAGLLSRK